MGTFSFKTCDTNQSIALSGTKVGSEQGPVFLLMPNGQPNVKESAYEGYGVFGDENPIDVYDWISKTNFNGHGDRETGIHLYYSRLVMAKNNRLVVIVKNGDYHQDLIDVFEHNVMLEGRKVVVIDGEGETIEDMGITFNQAILNCSLTYTSSSSFIKFPIKLSFNEGAVYEDCEDGSDDCEHQGYLDEELSLDEQYADAYIHEEDE